MQMIAPEPSDMELIPDAAWAPLLLAFGVCAVVSYGLNFSGRWKLRHLPGPAPSLFAGNLPELHGRNFWDVYAGWTRKYGRVYRWFQGRQGVVTIADPALIKEVLMTQFQTFHNRDIPGVVNTLNHGAGRRLKANMAWAQDKDWASARSAVMPFFHSKQLASYMADMKFSISRLTNIVNQHVAHNEPVDMRKHFGALALEMVGAAAFGIDFNTQSKATEDELVYAVNRSFKVTPALLNLGSIIETLPFLSFPIKLVVGCLQYLGSKEICDNIESVKMPSATTYMLLHNAERRIKGEPPKQWGPTVELPWGEGSFDTSKNKYKDAIPKEGSLPDLLMKGKHKLTGEKLTTLQMVGQSAVFILAGYDTTANTMSYCLWLLSQNPEEQDKVIAEVDSISKATEDLTMEDLELFPYTRAVIDETLRMYPTAPRLRRVAKKDTNIGSDRINIPAGTVINVDIFAMHHDPEFFPEPEVFRPSRFLKSSQEAQARQQYAYLPFGAGPRMCIGYKFALQEMMLTMITLMRSYTFSPDPDLDQPIMKSSGVVTMGPSEGVWLQVCARHTTAPHEP